MVWLEDIDSNGSVQCNNGCYNITIGQKHPQSLAVLYKYVIGGYMWKEHHKSVFKDNNKEEPTVSEWEKAKIYDMYHLVVSGDHLRKLCL